MDLPLQMPRPRFCNSSTICPFASSIFHIRQLQSPESILKALQRRGAALRRVERLQVLSRHATGLGANGSKDKHRNSLSNWRKDGPVESGGSTKSQSFSRGKGGKRCKTEVQPSITDVAKEPPPVWLCSKSNTRLSGVSRIVTDTSHRSIISKGISSIAGSGGTPENSSLQRSSHTTSLGVQTIEGESKSTMEPASNGPRLSKRSKKNPEEADILWRLNMCSKHADLHGALEIYDKIKREGVFQLKQHYYNVLLYICSGAASGSLPRGKSGKDTSKQADNDIQKSKIKTLMHSYCLSDGTRLDSKPLMDDMNGAVDDDKDTKEESEVDEAHFSPEEMELAAKRGGEIYEDMLQRNVPFNEATFTSIARLAVARGDGDLAFEMVKRMTAANIAPKLRSYGPALLSFCKDNEVQKAFEVDNHMLAAGVLPDESLLEALLKLSAEAGLQDKVYSLLHRVRTTVRGLSPTTVGTIERWFNSKVSAFAGKESWDSLPSKEDLKAATEAGGGGWHGRGWLGKGKWKARRTNISKAGTCLACGEQLCTIDIDPEETENFAKSVAELACQRENKSGDYFNAFQIWLDKHGPFDAVIDGANVGLYNPQFSQGFNFHQLNAVVNAARARSPSSRAPLVILHRRRTTDKSASSQKAQSMLKRWDQENALYSTPHGSNDDWYWLYAAVKSKCLLVTNDEMRDHLFELLGNDFFPKWKERHQVRFTFTPNALELHMPPPYSIIIQESLNGSWHVPQIGGDDITAPREWLCVTRPDPVHVVPASAENSSCHQKDRAETHESHLNELATELEVDLVNKKLLNVGMENSLDVNSLMSFQRAAGDCSSASSSSPLRSSGPDIKRMLPLSDSSPIGSKIIVKLEAAEEHAKVAIDFQI